MWNLIFTISALLHDMFLHSKHSNARTLSFKLEEKHAECLPLTEGRWMEFDKPVWALFGVYRAQYAVMS
jgi:hypothetical protein